MAAPVGSSRAQGRTSRSGSAAAPIEHLLAPFRAFAESNASSGLLLIAAALTALLWANSPFGTSYFELWDTTVTIGLGGLALSTSLLHWINDALMAVFFLVVGLEIKRELLVGELASRRRATLPVAAALGGAVLPALIFLAIVGVGPGERGWGIPMATDIAFALGVLALVGHRVPLGLRIFVTAFAIADDLIAVLVIALFFRSDLDLTALAASGALLLALLAANRLGVRRPLAYGLLGVALWVAVFQSGIHATVAGVALAFTIPAKVRIDSDAFVARARDIVDDFERRTVDGGDASIEENHAALWELEDETERAQSPMLRIEHGLQSWVAFLIVPLFALANAGVVLTDDVASTLAQPVAVGVMLGLIVGKQVGISVAAYVVVRLGLASLPDGVRWVHIYGAAWLGGIGFTMSLFIAALAFEDGPLLALAKVGILSASIVAGIGGYLVLRRSTSDAREDLEAPNLPQSG
jgi:NhaA family Na+:H+ antiporter